MRVLRIVGIVIGALVAIVIVVAVIVLLVGREATWAALFGPPERPAIDFATLVKAPTPNQYLVCPPDLCAEPDRIAPVLDVPVADLRDRFARIALSAPRVRRLSDPQTMQQDFVETSNLMRFPDTITVRFIPVTSNSSTLAIYSRAHYGKSDMGVNKARIDSWLDALEAE